MRTGTWLVVLAIGGILTFAVRTNTSVFDFHVAGFVIIIIAIIALVISQRGRIWLGRRMYVRRTRHLPDGEVEEGSYPPYILQNPGTARGMAGLPGRVTLPPHPNVPFYTQVRGGGRQPGEESRPSAPRFTGTHDSGTGGGGGRHARHDDTPRDGDTAPQPIIPPQMEPITPQQMEIIEDIYEE
jgi:hypothetical protein